MEIQYNMIIYIHIILIQSGTTALMDASMNLSMVEFLVDKDASIDIQNTVRNNNYYLLF